MSRPSETLRAGDRAPAFRLSTQRGDLKSLEGLLQHGPVLLVFHRGTWCPSCRRRLGHLAKRIGDFRQRGWQVVPILTQAAEPVRLYVEETGLPFNILLDPTRDTAKAYGVWHRMGVDAWNIARPAAFLIDRSGLVRYLFVSSWQGGFPAVDELLGAIDTLKG